MSAPREFEGRDLEEALASASATLGVPASDFTWEMVEEGRRGVFGLGARLVRIRVTEAPAPDLAPPRPEVPRADAPASAASPPQELVATVSRILALMGFGATVETSAHAGGWTIRIGGPDRKHLVKRDGEVLEALEFLLNRMGRRAFPGAGSIRVTCDGFRDRRDDEIVALTREVAALVARSGRPETLHEMNPYERRLVHLTVREFQGVVSRSEGDGFLKRVRLEKASD